MHLPPLSTSSSSIEECHGINPKPSQAKPKPTPKVGNTMILFLSFFLSFFLNSLEFTVDHLSLSLSLYLSFFRSRSAFRL